LRDAPQVVKFAAFIRFEKPIAELFDKIVNVKDKEREQLREYVNRWKETGEFLEKLRREEARNINIYEEIMSLSDASEAALRMYPPKPTSGLIEMQKLFMKLKK
jgi:hypothetical protein